MRCIYAIINLVNGKKYIGSTSNFARRKKEHIFELDNNKHHSAILQNSWKKHGKENFIFSVLKKVEQDEDLLKIEQEYLDKFQVYRKEFGYNICSDARAPINTNPAIKEVYQIDLNGKIIDLFSNSVKAAEIVLNNHYCSSGIIKCANNKYRFYKGFIWIFKKDLSKENLEKKVFLANNKPERTLETREKVRQTRLGKGLSKEIRQKISDNHKGKRPKNLDNLHLESRKPVDVFDLDGNLIDTFEMVSDCLKKYPGAGNQLLGKTKKPRKYVFKYKQE